LKSFYILKFEKKNCIWLGSCWEKTWAGGGQQASVRCWLYYMCATQTIATPAPASETHLKEKMLAFAATTTVHVRGKRERENTNLEA
jgi:hypothetical protein